MIDVSKTIERLPTLSDQALARVRGNVAAWLACDDEERREAAAEVDEALRALDVPVSAADYDALLPDERLKRLTSAFARRPASETESKAIAVLVRYPGTTSTELSRRLGWEGQSWHAHFGAACHAREDLLWRALPSPEREARFYSSILADLEPGGSTFRLKADLVDTLAQILGLPLVAAKASPA